MHSASTRSSRAFSIIEIIVVVVVIGILAVMVIPKATAASEEAQAATLLNQVREIGAAAERYQATTGEWPVSAMGESAIEAAFAGYIKPGHVPSESPFGGAYGWYNTPSYKYLSLQVNPYPQTFVDACRMIDETMDDSEQWQGRVLYTTGGANAYLFYLVNRGL